MVQGEGIGKVIDLQPPPTATLDEVIEILLTEAWLTLTPGVARQAFISSTLPLSDAVSNKLLTVFICREYTREGRSHIQIVWKVGKERRRRENSAWR